VVATCIRNVWETSKGENGKANCLFWGCGKDGLNNASRSSLALPYFSTGK